MTIAAVPDAELAAAAKLGDKEAFSGLYERYFDRIFDFLSRVTRDRELAADLAQDTFVRAMQRMDQLEEPSAFRGWLYAIARTQALNRIQRERRSTPTDPQPDADEAPGPLLTEIDPDRLSDPDQVARAEEVAELVWAAAGALDERTYTVLDLSVRHELTSAEIAEIMGVSKGNASVMVNRMRERAGAAIAATLMARYGARSCPELRAVLGADPDLSLDDATKRTINRHVEGCEECSETKRRIATPQQIMAAYAATPPPDGLRDAVWSEIDRRWDAEGPGRTSGRALARLVATAAFLALIVAMGVAGAVQIVEPDPDLVAVEPVATTTTSTTSPVTTSTTMATTTSTVSPDTTAPPTTVADETPTTRVAPPPPTTVATPPTTAAPTTTLPPNNPPVVTIVSPNAGNQDFAVPDPYPLAMEATVVDDHDTGLEVVWTSDQEDWSVAGNDTTVSVQACMSSSHTIRATAIDSRGAEGFDEVTIWFDCPPQ